MWQSVSTKGYESTEMIQSWHIDLVKYENLTSLSRRNRKIFHFTTSYKTNSVKFVNTPPVLRNETVKRYEMVQCWHTVLVKCKS